MNLRLLMVTPFSGLHLVSLEICSKFIFNWKIREIAKWLYHRRDPRVHFKDVKSLQGKDSRKYCVTVYIHMVNNVLISTGAVISGNIKNLKYDKDKANIPSHDDSGNWFEMGHLCTYTLVKFIYVTIQMSLKMLLFDS